MAEEYQDFSNFELRGGKTAEQFEELLNDILQNDVSAESAPTSEEAEQETATAIKVRWSGAGLGVAGTAVVVAFAPVAAKILSDLWDKVFLPAIEKRWGKGAVKRVD